MLRLGWSGCSWWPSGLPSMVVPSSQRAAQDERQTPCAMPSFSFPLALEKAAAALCGKVWGTDAHRDHSNYMEAAAHVVPIAHSAFVQQA